MLYRISQHDSALSRHIATCSVEDITKPLTRPKTFVTQAFGSTMHSSAFFSTMHTNAFYTL